MTILIVPYHIFTVILSSCAFGVFQYLVNFHKTFGELFLQAELVTLCGLFQVIRQIV